MKTLLLAAVVALLCMQTLNANPVSGQTYVEGGSEGGETKVTTSETSADGTVTTTTRTETSSGGTMTAEEAEAFIRQAQANGGQVSYSSQTSYSSGSSSSGSGSGSSSSGSGSGSGSDSGSGSSGSTSSGSTSSGSTSSGSTSSGSTSSGSTTSGSTSSSTDGEIPYDFELSDAELGLEETTTTTTTTTTYGHDHDHTCEELLAERNTDNDNLTRQLQSASKTITSLGEEKNWVLNELAECRDEYTCMSADYEKSQTTVKTVTTRYQAAHNDAIKLKTLLMTANSEGQKWKTRAEHFEIELKEANQVNVELKITVNKYSTQVTNLQTQINEITIKNNQCGAESSEWKLKFQSENSIRIKYEQNIRELQATIDDLKSKNEKTNVDLASCRSENQENDAEIDTLKSSVTTLTNQVKETTIDLGNCQTELRITKKDFSDDEIQDGKDLMLLDETRRKLESCQASNTEIETKYESEKALAIKYKNEIVVIREECANRYKKYDDDIDQLTIKFKGSLATCEDNLDTERKTISQIRIDITNLENRITEINGKLDIQIQITGEWQKKNDNCENSSATLRQTIETLTKNVADTNTRLDECVENSAEIQATLSECQGDLTTCNTDLSASGTRVTERDSTIVTLKGEIAQLTTSKNNVEGELSSLRCEVNQFLNVIDNAESKALQAIIDIKGIFDDSRNALDRFVDSHNIECESCGTNGPCITDGASAAGPPAPPAP